MKGNFFYTLNHIALAFLICLLLESYPDYLFVFVILELFLLWRLKGALFSIYKAMFFVSFINLFLINNFYFWGFSSDFGFIQANWIRILKLFIFSSWIMNYVSLENFLNFLVYIKMKAEFIYLIMTALVILKRIPINLKQIHDVQKAKQALPKNVHSRLLIYPMMVVPLIVSIIRDLNCFNINFYTLEFYRKGIPSRDSANKILASVTLTTFLSVLIIYVISKEFIDFS